MEPDIPRIKNWVKELRSGKWEQYRGGWYSKETGNFCALGVGIRLIDSEKMRNEQCIGRHKFTTFYGFNGGIKIPPYLRKVHDLGTQHRWDNIIHLNDTYGFTFDEIADCVEYTFGNKECILEKHRKMEEDARNKKSKPASD